MASGMMTAALSGSGFRSVGGTQCVQAEDRNARGRTDALLGVFVGGERAAKKQINKRQD